MKEKIIDIIKSHLPHFSKVDIDLCGDEIIELLQENEQDKSNEPLEMD